MLPRDIVWRRKAGFGAPVRSWLVGDSRTRCSRTCCLRTRSAAAGLCVLPRWLAFAPTTKPGLPIRVCSSTRCYPSSCGCARSCDRTWTWRDLAANSPSRARVNRLGGSRLDSAQLSAAIDRTEQSSSSERLSRLRPVRRPEVAALPVAVPPVVSPDSVGLPAGAQTPSVPDPAIARHQEGPQPGDPRACASGNDVQDARRSNRQIRDVSFIVSELRRLATPGFSGPCWGYDFDWQARYATIPAFHPTIVATGFVTNALYQLYRLDGNQRAAELVVGVDRVPRPRSESHGDRPTESAGRTRRPIGSRF